MEDLEIIRIRLEDHFDTIYRTIWVQRSRSINDIIITLFPIDNSGYRMIPLRGLTEVTYEEVLLRLEANGL